MRRILTVTGIAIGAVLLLLVLYIRADVVRTDMLRLARAKVLLLSSQIGIASNALARSLSEPARKEADEGDAARATLLAAKADEIAALSSQEISAGPAAQSRRAIADQTHATLYWTYWRSLLRDDEVDRLDGDGAGIGYGRTPHIRWTAEGGRLFYAGRLFKFDLKTDADGKAFADPAPEEIRAARFADRDGSWIRSASPSLIHYWHRPDPEDPRVAALTTVNVETGAGEERPDLQFPPTLRFQHAAHGIILMDGQVRREEGGFVYVVHAKRENGGGAEIEIDPNDRLRLAFVPAADRIAVVVQARRPLATTALYPASRLKLYRWTGASPAPLHEFALPEPLPQYPTRIRLQDDGEGANVARGFAASMLLSQRPLYAQIDEEGRPFVYDVGAGSIAPLCVGFTGAAKSNSLRFLAGGRLIALRDAATGDIAVHSLAGGCRRIAVIRAAAAAITQITELQAGQDGVTLLLADGEGKTYRAQVKLNPAEASTRQAGGASAAPADGSARGASEATGELIDLRDSRNFAYRSSADEIVGALQKPPSDPAAPALAVTVARDGQISLWSDNRRDALFMLQFQESAIPEGLGRAHYATMIDEERVGIVAEQGFARMRADGSRKAIWPFARFEIPAHVPEFPLTNFSPGGNYGFATHRNFRSVSVISLAGGAAARALTFTLPEPAPVEGEGAPPAEAIDYVDILPGERRLIASTRSISTRKIAVADLETAFGTGEDLVFRYADITSRGRFSVIRALDPAALTSGRTLLFALGGDGLSVIDLDEPETAIAGPRTMARLFGLPPQPSMSLSGRISGAITGLEVSADGRFLAASTSADKGVRLFRLRIDPDFDQRLKDFAADLKAADEAAPPPEEMEPMEPAEPSAAEGAAPAAETATTPGAASAASEDAAEVSSDVAARAARFGDALKTSDFELTDSPYTSLNSAIDITDAGRVIILHGGSGFLLLRDGRLERKGKVFFPPGQLRFFDDHFLALFQVASTRNDRVYPYFDLSDTVTGGGVYSFVQSFPTTTWHNAIENSRRTRPASQLAKVAIAGGEAGDRVRVYDLESADYAAVKAAAEAKVPPKRTLTEAERTRFGVPDDRSMEIFRAPRELEMAAQFGPLTRGFLMICPWRDDSCLAPFRVFAAKHHKQALDTEARMREEAGETP